MGGQDAAPRARTAGMAAGYKALQRLTVAVRSQVDLRRVLDGLVADAGRQLALRLCALARWDESGRFFHVVHEHRRDGAGLTHPSLAGRRFIPGSDPAYAGFENLLFTQHCAFVSPLAGSPGSRGRAHDLHPFLTGLESAALVVAPLLAEHQVLGLLVATRSGDLAWSEDDVEFLRAASDLAAMALQHASLRSRLNVLSSAPSEMNAALDRRALGRRVTESAMLLTSARSGLTGWREGDLLVCREIRRFDRWEPIDLRVPLGRGLAGWCCSHRVPYVANEAATDPNADPEVVRALRVEAMLDVPILDRDGEAIGFLELHDKATGVPFGDDDIVLTTALAHMAALSYERNER